MLVLMRMIVLLVVAMLKVKVVFVDLFMSVPRISWNSIPNYGA